MNLGDVTGVDLSPQQHIMWTVLVHAAEPVNDCTANSPALRLEPLALPFLRLLPLRPLPLLLLDPRDASFLGDSTTACTVLTRGAPLRQSCTCWAGPLGCPPVSGLEAPVGVAAPTCGTGGTASLVTPITASVTLGVSSL